jgi:hypothetical protein
MRTLGRVGGLALALLLGATALRAQGLISPGPLATAHARYDNLNHCLACHDAGRGLSGSKCLTCHVSLGARIRADKGYHAVATKHGAELACRTCHSEHNGRPYRLVRWPNNVPREQFDHRSTGYSLEGAHARQRCEACHRSELVLDAAVRADTSLSTRRTYLGVSTACASCHLDEHRGRVSRQCQDCHTQTEWKPAPRFDHATTRFPLTGKHADAKCDQCHEVRRAVAIGPTGQRDTSFVDFRAGRPGQTQRAGATGTACASCHTSPHRQAGRSGRCEPCHTTRSWFDLPDSVRSFDHTAIGFTLRGAHARAECEACHLSSRGAPLSEKAVLVRANFVRPFARQRIRFNRCDACHTDVHEGQLGADANGRDCSACHTEVRFTPTRFSQAQHDSTAFRLVGAHQATACSRCHPALPGSQPGSGAIRFRQADRACMACHRDEHGGQFAGRIVPGARGVPSGIDSRQPTLCETCHGVEAWKPITFEHDSTRYPLRGAHRRLACGRCHTRPAGASPDVPITYSGLPTTTCNASGCHTDPHRGQFADRSRGGECTTCHSEDGWQTLLFDHQQDSDWPLDGAHVDVRCVECHRPEGRPPFVRYRPLPHACEDCHPAEPDRRRRL